MKKMARETKLKILAWATAVCLVLTVFFPGHGEGTKTHVLYYGFPEPFLTVYTREFFLRFESYQYGEPIFFFQRFTMDLGILSIDIVLIWLVLVFFYKRFYKRAGASGAAQNRKGQSF